MKPVRDIIVVGASRGGLQALRRLLGSLPAQVTAPILIVLHTSSTGPRLLAGLLQRSTRRQVAYAAHGEELRPDHVYLAPPDLHMIVTNSGHLGLDDGAKVRHARPAVDPLFISAAKVFGPRVIGIVLTGGDHDGTDGLHAIKLAGGVSIVQQPQEAVDPAMPLSALTGDDPDYCVSLDEMGALVAELVIGIDRQVS